MAARKASTKKPSTKKQDELSFEESLQRLSSIVGDLESGELNLEDSLARFEEGVGLARQTQAALDAAETRVERLLSDDGSLATEPVRTEPIPLGDLDDA